MLINPLCLSNYLAPSSRCWADVCGEVSAALPALLRDIAAQHFPRTGQVMGWERHPQSLGRGWEEKAMNWFSPLCCLVQGLPQSVTGQTGEYGETASTFSARIGAAWARVYGQSQAGSQQHLACPERKDCLSPRSSPNQG